MSSPPDPLFHGHANGDDAGLICGWCFSGDGRLPQPIDAAQATRWLAAPPVPGAYLWLHFNLSHAPAERWLKRHADLGEAFHDTLAEDLPSTRIERTDEGLLAVINDLHYDFGFEPSDISTLWISVGPRLVVTARTRPLRSVDALRTAVKAGEAPGSAAQMLAELLRAQADVLVQIVRDGTSRIDRIEDQLLAGRLDTQRIRLGMMRRVMVRMQRLLAPEPAALFRLLQRPPAWMSEDDVQDLRAASEEFSVVLRDMAGLQERIRLLQEEIAANVNEDNARSLFVLTVVTVLALPINILAGLFGMNVGGIPLAEHRHGFWIVVAIVLGFTAIAAWMAFGRKRGRG